MIDVLYYIPQLKNMGTLKSYPTPLDLGRVSI